MDFLSKLLTREPPSKDTAKRRLQLVLVHDRQPLSPGLLQSIRDDIVVAISKHIEVDKENAQLTLSQAAGRRRLIVDVPILGRDKRS